MKRYFLLSVLFYFLCYILPLGSPGLFVPDETRYAEIPREMIATGDWVVPHLDGLRYFEKPVLGYWVHAVSLLIFGENNFAVRLPSAVSAGLSSLLIFLMVRSVSSSNKNEKRYLAALAALIYLSCFEVFGIGNIAVLDNLFSFFLAATITAFYFASEKPPGSTGEKIFLIVSGVACGLAFLTKGFLAFAIPVLAVVPYLIWERRYSDLIRMFWLPILVAVLTALPWCIMIHMRESDFWHFFFWNEHMRRFLEDNAQHKESFWFFFLRAPGLFMPWAFLVPSSVAGLKPLVNDGSKQARIIRYCICWCIFPFLFFSASSGKLLTYILPCFPPFAVLMYYGLVNIVNKRQNNIFRWGVTGTGLFFGLILFAMLYVELIGFDDFHLFREPWKLIMFANSLIVIIIFCFWAAKSSKMYNRILMIGIAPFFFFFIIHLILPDATIVRKIPGAVLENKQNINNGSIVISDEKVIAAACWYLKRNDIYLINSGGELDYGLSYPDAHKRLIDLNSIEGFIDENRGNTALTGRVRNLEKWKRHLPRPESRDDSGPEGYAIWQY